MTVLVDCATRRASAGLSRHTPSGWIEKSPPANTVVATKRRTARSTTGRIGSALGVRPRSEAAPENRQALVRLVGLPQ